MLRVFSFQIADSIDIKQLRINFTAEIYYEDTDELFYRIAENKFIYIFKFGIVCFLNYNEVEMSAFIQFLKPYARNLFSNRLSEEFEIVTNAQKLKFGYNKIEIEGAGTELKKFIGRTLNLKNRIAENLYIFDSPDETWEDENLNKLDIGLKKTFDLQVRFRNISEGLAIVKENFELFKDLLQARNSILLEWIVIILILIEVLNLIIDKIFK
jgi:uncharacterized Rmd1/YagE family protein